MKSKENYTCIFSVRCDPPTVNFPSKKFGLDMFLVVEKEITKKICNAKTIHKFPLNPCNPFTIKQALKSEGLDTSDIPPIDMMIKRVHANPGTTLHIMNAEFKVTREMMELYIDGLNHGNETTMQKLRDCKIA